MANPSEWVDAVVRRLSTALPHRPHNQLWTPVNVELLSQTVGCIKELSLQEFACVINGLGLLLQNLIKDYPPASTNEKEVDSYCTILDCITSCLAKQDGRTLDDDDLHSLQQLYQRITQLCLLPGEQMGRLSSAANRVLYHLSGLHFHGIFNKIILRVTSMNRLESSSFCGDQQSVMELIPYLNLNAARLQQILQVMVTSFKELKKHRQLFTPIPPILHRSIWNFVAEYPLQFNELLHNDYPALERSAERLFNLCDEYADNQRRKIQVWPLQNTLLILCPHILADIAESGLDKSTLKHKNQRGFLSSIMKGLSSGKKDMCEAATICAVDIFKACTFVGDRSNSIFRYLVAQTQGQLQHLLFSPYSPFLHQPSSLQAGVPTFTDLELMVTCLAAQFRLNHRNTHIFTVCLDTSSPAVFRLAFVEGLRIVLMEVSMSWWPGREAVYTYAPKLREIFQSVLPQLRRYDTSSPSLVGDIKAYFQNPTAAANMLAAKSRAERKHLVEMITHYQLIRGLIKLFACDPMLAFSFPSEDVCMGECLQLMTGLVGLVQHQSIPHLPLGASEVLLTLHSPENILLWDKKDPMGAFWDISGQVTYSIAMKLFSRKSSNAIQLLEWLKQILHYRTLFLKKHESEASLGSSCKISQQMYTMLETVLLLFLRNTDIEAVRIAMSCFKYLVTEAELVMSPTEPSAIPYSPNLRAYKQLEEASKTLQIGRAAQQKKIRAILRELVHTPGSALAWEDTNSSWRVTKSLLISYQRPREDLHAAPPDLLRFTTDSFPRNIMKRVGQQGSKEQQLTDENLQQTLLNWTNMTGFLCSLAGVSTKPSSSYSMLLLSSGSHSISMIDGDLPSVVVQQPVKDPIHIRLKRSSSLHSNRPKSLTSLPSTPRSAGGESMLASSNGVLEDCLQHSRASQTEAFISELMQLLSCDNEAVGVNIREAVKELVSYELSPPVYPYLFQCMTAESMNVVGLEKQPLINDNNTALFDQLVSIVQRILETKVEGALEHLVHVKIDDIVRNLAIYIDNLDNSVHSLTIRIKFCNLISTVMQHSRDLSFRQEVPFRNLTADHLTQWVSREVSISENSSHEESLHNELDLSVMRAVGLVLSGLVLQPKDMTGDIIDEKGKLFLKYFTSFMNLIHSLNRIEWSKLSTIHKQPLLRHVASLREATIRAMSNMLTANIDSGLTHAISLGYHEDLKTRTSFIEVLTSILKQGAEFNSLADTALADRYNSMLELVTEVSAEGDFPIMMALINSVPPEHVDELAEVLVVLFDYKNKLSSFLTTILNTEVEALESGRLDTLFRGNSIACKVLSCSFKTFGLYYLQSVVRPLILQLMKSNDRDYEVDPMRLSDPSKLKQNQSNLLELVQTFYTTILNSLPSLPLQLRTVCHILYSVVVAHFPESSLDTVNSALFLRFVNPAIVSPQSYNLVQGEIPISVRRGLTFISKVLQNLANHITFKKEAHMEVFNEFLTDNFQRSRELALAMASMGPYCEGEAVEYIAFLKEAHKHRLHTLLWNNQERMAAYAASIRMGVSSRDLFHQLNTLVAQLGAPKYRRKRTSVNTRSALVSSQLEEFLDSMANECDEKTLRSIKAKDIFYQGGVSRAGNPVFYFVARKFRGDQLHTSYQLLYHIMTLLKSCTDKAFELVIDLTQASQYNEPDLELLVKFAAYVPELVMSQIELIYFFNTNLAFRQYASKLATAIRIFSHIKGTKRVVMVENLNRFSEFIDPSELKLPAGTLAFEEEGRVDFSNVHFLMFKQSVTLQIPAALQVCSCGFSVSFMDRVKVFEIPTILKEVYHISDIREVFTEDKNSLAMRLVEGGQMLKFMSTEAEAIVKSVGVVISRWQNQQPEECLPSWFCVRTYRHCAMVEAWLYFDDSYSQLRTLLTELYPSGNIAVLVFAPYSGVLAYLVYESRYMSERKLEPKDVPGAFLNLALLNLGSTEAGLRVAAYKLLSAVKDAFHLRIDRHLESSHDLCIPKNSAQFVISISEQLARSEPHLTLEFLSEVVAGFQQYTFALKQMCLAYMSPWLPNLSRFVVRCEGVTTEQEKVMKIIDLLVALTISEEEMYPLIQAHVWTRIGREARLVKMALDSFIRMSISDGLGSRKLEVLADTTVMLEQGSEGVVASEIIKRMLKTVAHTSDRVTHSLEQHFLWSELTVLSRFLLALSFNNKVNVVMNLADMFYLCVLMMGYGPVFVRATIHGIVINTVQSLASLPEVMGNEEALKEVSLKLVEFSDPKFFLQFGIQNTASVAAYQGATEGGSRHKGIEGKDVLSSAAVITCAEYLLEVVASCVNLFPECGWMARWQKLAKRTSFYYNPALQSRSFLMLGVISQRASMSIITRTLKVLEETLGKHEDEIMMLEAIVICLTRMVPLLDENTRMTQHLFWVAVGILQLSETTLFAAGVTLMEACIKAFSARNEFEKQHLAAVTQPTRDAMEWPLSQMDREIGISFSSDFNFALAGLLYKGFSHPLSTVRTRTQELLTTLFFIHSPEESAVIEVNEHNLPYLTALFPESEIMREQLCDRRSRLKSFVTSFTEGEEDMGSYSALLSTQTIHTHKLQILLLFMLSSALIQTQDEQKIQLLYEFLADASKVYSEVFPLIHCVLVEHMAQTLQQSQCTPIVRAVQKLISVAVERSNSSVLLKPSFISDIGFAGLGTFFRPFPKHGLIYPTAQGALFQKYLETLIQELSPSQESPDKPSMHLSKLSHSLTSMKDIPYSLPPPPLPPRRSGSSAVRYSTAPKDNSSNNTFPVDEEDIVEETDL